MEYDTAKSEKKEAAFGRILEAGTPVTEIIEPRRIRQQVSSKMTQNSNKSPKTYESSATPGLVVFFFNVILWRPNFVDRRFGILSLFQIHKLVSCLNDL